MCVAIAPNADAMIEVESAESRYRKRGRWMVPDIGIPLSLPQCAYSVCAREMFFYNLTEWCGGRAVQ